MSPQDFISKLAPYAISEQRRTDILASITIAQGALESGWGRSAPGNNLFGIKGSGQEFIAQEYINDHFVTVTDGFRVYDSWEGSVIDHSNFLIENRRYARAGFFECCNNLDYAGAAQALQVAGYATDPQYAAKLISLIRNWGLDQYDLVKAEEEEYEMSPGDANKIIEFLAAGYGATSDQKARDEFHRLANELRKASGQQEE